MGVCEALLPDVMVPETHQNDRSYVSELSGPSFNSLHKNLAWWVVKWRTSKKKHETVKIGGWALAQDSSTVYRQIYTLDVTVLTVYTLPICACTISH